MSHVWHMCCGHSRGRESNVSMTLWLFQALPQWLSHPDRIGIAIIGTECKTVPWLERNADRLSGSEFSSPARGTPGLADFLEKCQHSLQLFYVVAGLSYLCQLRLEIQHAMTLFGPEHSNQSNIGQAPQGLPNSKASPSLVSLGNLFPKWQCFCLLTLLRQHILLNQWWLRKTYPRLCTNFTPTQITPIFWGCKLTYSGMAPNQSLPLLDCGDAPFGEVTTAGTRWRMRSRQLRHCFGRGRSSQRHFWSWIRRATDSESDREQFGYPGIH